MFFLFFSHYHWWNRVFNIRINSILHWVMSQKYWGLHKMNDTATQFKWASCLKRAINLIIFPGQCGFPSLMVWSASFILTLLQSNAYLRIVNGRIKEHNPEKLLPCSNTAGQRLKIANSKAKSRRSLSRGNPPPFTILPWGYLTTKLCNCISFILHHW